MPSATTTPQPLNRTRSADAATRSRLGRPIAYPCSMITGVSGGTKPRATRLAVSGPAAVPVAGSSQSPTVGLKNRAYATAPAVGS